MPTVYQLALSATIITVLLTGGVLSPRVATAAAYYVATDGSDANPGTESEPFGTIDQGVSVLQAGDTLYIRGGTYDNQNIGQHAAVQLPSGTSWSNAVTIAGYPGETVDLYNGGISIVNGTSYVIFDNLILDGGGLFLDCVSHHIRFQNGEMKNLSDSLVTGCGSYLEVLNSKIHNSDIYGFYWGGHDSVFDGNEVYDNGGYAYHILSAGQNNVSNNIVSNNIIHGNGFGYLPGGNINGGVILASGSNNQAYNNLVYGNFSGIQVDYTHGGTHNRVSNNIIYDNTYYGINIGAGALNTIVEDNIIYQNGYAIEDYGVGTILINNLMTDP